MSDPGFRPYALRISSLGDGQFRATVQRSLWGEATRTFSRPPVPTGPHGEPLPTDAAEIARSGPDTASAFGRWLRDEVLGERIVGHLKTNLALADEQGVTLQLQLWLSEAGELATWPWEYLLHPDGDQDVPWCIGPGAPTLVRCLDLEHDAPPLVTRPPLKILVVISEPSDPELGPIDGLREWLSIWDAVTESTGTDGMIALELLRPPTFDAVAQRLLRNDIHVLHVVGHGEYDAAAQLGRLYFEDRERGSDPRTSAQLRFLLANRSSLRLVVVNACEGARAASSARLSGLAQSLVQARLPAVVAMQAQIWNTAAKRFTSYFYGALAAGQSVDAAIGEARRSLIFNDLAEWGVPVLFTRSADCRIFDRAALDAMTDQERYTIRLNGWLAFANQCLRDNRPDEADRWLRQLPGNWGNAFELRAEAARLRNESAGQPAPTRLAARPTRDELSWLVHAILEGRVVPFLGWRANLCGRPDTAEWRPGHDPPGGTELARHLADTFDYPGTAREDLARVTQFILLFHGRPDLYRELRRLYSAVCQPTLLHQLLAQLPAMVRARSSTPAFPVIFTTNYDDLLERAFAAADEPYDLIHAVSWSESGTRDRRLAWWHTPWQEQSRAIDPPDAYDGLRLGSRSTIVRLVGMTEGLSGGRNGCLITEDDHLAQLSGDRQLRQLPKVLATYLKEQRFLFLGYDLCNWEQRVIVRRVLGDQDAPAPPWVVGGDVDGLDEKLWQEFKPSHLPGSLEEFISTLRNRLEGTP